MKRGQAALEFLMTYGWAILAVLISIVALAYFGVLSPSLLLPESCTLFPGVACTDFSATSLEVYLVVQNGMGKGLNQFDLSMPGCGIGSASNGLSDGEKETIVIPMCSFSGKTRLKDSILVTYNDGILTHNRAGSLTASLETNINKAGSKYKAVNFRAAASGLVTGYLDDTGAVYGLKADGNTYGWTVSNAVNMRTRATTPGTEPKELLRSFASVPNTQTATWEIELPNGNYYVGLASGDSEFQQGPITLSLEGVPVPGINGMTSSLNSFLVSNDIAVTINDGKLTMSIGTGSGSSSSIVNYIRTRPR